MQVELKFEEPFYGVAYADFDRNSACIFKGRGSTSAKLELPLKGMLSLSSDLQSVPFDPPEIQVFLFTSPLTILKPTLGK